MRCVDAAKWENDGEMKIVFFLQNHIGTHFNNHHPFCYCHCRGRRRLVWQEEARRRPGGCHVGFSSRLAWWVAQTEQGIKIVFFSTKQLKLTLRKHRPFRHRYYRGGARVGVAGGGQKGCRTLLQIWCDGRCNPCEVRGILDSGLKWSMSYIGLHYLNVINVTNGLYNLFQIIFDVRWE